MVRGGKRFTSDGGFRRLLIVFVAVVCELGSEDRQKDVHALLRQYGFEQVYRDLYESVTMKESLLPRLKRDLDRHTDSYDRMRLYQYPLEGTLIITTLHNKKWRRTVLRS